MQERSVLMEDRSVVGSIIQIKYLIGFIISVQSLKC